ncbi:MAG TPA: hypothetical protein VMT20_04555 [Terriglobia bacterium]|nr:hypothetical protein [Terriglobia bacterium]
MGTKAVAAMTTLEVKPLQQPPLVWAAGTVHQILVQPGEYFYIFALKSATDTVFLRIADPHTGAPIAGVTSDNPVFDLLKVAYLQKLTVQVGYRDFGPDPQAGINKLCIDRVSLTQ